MEPGKFRQLQFGNLKCLKIENEACDISLWYLLETMKDGLLFVCVVFTLYVHDIHAVLYIIFRFIYEDHS